MVQLLSPSQSPISQKPFVKGMARPIGRPHALKVQADYKEYKEKLDQFPKDSINRLATIKRVEAEDAPRHVKHVALAIGYGLRDSNIGWLNSTIRALQKVRNANRNSDPAVSATAQKDLVDLRDAMSDTLKEPGFDAIGQKLDQQA